MLQKWLLKINVEVNVFGFEQYSPTACPEWTCTKQHCCSMLKTVPCNAVPLPCFSHWRIKALRTCSSQQFCGSTWEHLWICIVLLWKNTSQEMPPPTPHPFKHIMGEVWVKCPFSSWTAIITSDPAAHGGSSWYQSSASETSCTSTASVMGMRQTAPFLSSSCSKLSFPASFRLLIHVLLPHIWLGAWSHFLDLIPSSCLLPALSHRG